MTYGAVTVGQGGGRIPRRAALVRLRGGAVQRAGNFVGSSWAQRNAQADLADVDRQLFSDFRDRYRGMIRQGSIKNCLGFRIGFQTVGRLTVGSNNISPSPTCFHVQGSQHGPQMGSTLYGNGQLGRERKPGRINAFAKQQWNAHSRRV